MSKSRAIVASGHPLVSQAAMAVMAQGGNAYDGAIAAGFTAAVAEPALTSLGGGGFLLAHKTNGQSTLFDFFSNTPGNGHNDQDLEPHFFPVTICFSGSDQDFNVGMGSVAVPGNLKGFIHVHNKLGRLPLAEVLQPAIDAARKGVKLRLQQAHFLHLLYPIMTMTEEGKKLFEPDSKYLTCGDLFHNYDLANFMEHLPHDLGEDFYTGKIAGIIAADMEQNQGLLTSKDLATYQVIEREPLKTNYRGFSLLTNPPPSFGGSLIGLTLELLEKKSFNNVLWGSEKHLDILIKTLLEVEELRAVGEHLDNENAQPDITNPQFSRGTTHISVVDYDGNVASMTTSNGEGSGYIVPGTGIMLNNMMGEDDLHPEGFHACPPGQRVASMMSPSVLIDEQEQVELVIGSGGSKRIRTAIVQVLSNIFDFGKDIDQAVQAPRLHWDGETLQVEPGYNEINFKQIKNRLPVNFWSKRNVYFGGVNAVFPGKSGAGDLRRGGDSQAHSAEIES